MGRCRLARGMQRDAVVLHPIVRSIRTGSAGTLTTERVVIRPNKLRRLSPPGPVGTYQLDRFSAARVELRMGPVQPGMQGGPNDVV